MGRSAMIALALATTLLAACDKTFEYEWNQRVTVVVETPDGEVSGSGVIRAYYHFGQHGGGANHTWRTLAGEYPVIDLADQRYFVAVMGAGVASDTGIVTQDNASYDALTFAVPNPERPYSMVDKVRSLRDAPRNEPRPLISLPLFVTFGDPDDPLTIRRVDPDEFEAVFGTGYRLKAVMIELTDDPPTEGAMREAFPWLVDIERRNVLLDGNTVHGTSRTKNFLANKLGKGAFTMEDFDAAQ